MENIVGIRCILAGTIKRTEDEKSGKTKGKVKGSDDNISSKEAEKLYEPEFYTL